MDPFTSASLAPTGTSTLTLASFLARFSEVATEADGYLVPCPSHSDRSPSLRVAHNADAATLVLKCRAGCRTKDVVEALGLRMADLFGVLAGDVAEVRSVGSDSAAPSVADVAALGRYLAAAASALPDSQAADYALRRFGLAPERAAELGLGYDAGSLAAPGLTLSRGLYHDAPRLVVPFRRFDGTAHYLQARALSGEVRAKWSGPANPDGATWGRYGFVSGDAGQVDVVIAEGPGDGLTAASAGFDSVFIRGAALGSNVALADEIAAGTRGRRVVVAGDADAAGQRFTREVARALSERDVDVHRLVIPDGAGEDLTDWRAHSGHRFTDELVTAVKGAPRYGSDQIVAEEIAQEITRLFSDVYNARVLLSAIRRDGDDIRHTPEVGFVVYRATRGTWAPDAEEWARSKAQQVAAIVHRAILAQVGQLDARVAAVEDPDTRKALGALVDQHRRKARSGQLVSYVESTRGIDAMLRELRALPGVHASYEDFDRHAHLLAAGNGVVDLESGELRPFGPATKDLLLMRRVEVPYRAGARCPRWEQFVGEVFEGRPGLPEFVQRLVGYGITGHTTEQCLAVLYGTGSNGKGVFLETLAGIFRGITTTTPFSTFEMKPSGGIPNDIAALKGSRLVMASEGEHGRPMAEALIKRLTGGDTISARFMRREFFEFTPAFLIMLATNYRPNFRGQDHGLWRRVKLLPFDRTFAADSQDRHLTAKFLGRRVPGSAHRPGDDFGDGPAGILAWAVAGAVQWHRAGLDEPAAITGATQHFRETSDNLRDFYDEFLVVDPAGKIGGHDVWALYQQWCEEEGLDRHERWRRATFWSALEERGAQKVRPGGSTSFVGIRRRRPSEAAGENTPAGRLTEAPGADIKDAQIPAFAG